MATFTLGDIVDMTMLWVASRDAHFHNIMLLIKFHNMAML